MAMMTTVYNLDRLAAERAQAIIHCLLGDKQGGETSGRASDVENTITKTLGVLQENGVYACFLYLMAKEKKRYPVFVKEMIALLDGLGFGWGKPEDYSSGKVLSYISDKVMADTGPDALEFLILAKETLEKMLIYARYGAKAHE